MSIVTSWLDLVEEVSRKFPEAPVNDILTCEGDMGALMLFVAKSHDLTFAEAAEMVTFRLPQYLEAERLSA